MLILVLILLSAGHCIFGHFQRIKKDLTNAKDKLVDFNDETKADPYMDISWSYLDDHTYTELISNAILHNDNFTTSLSFEDGQFDCPSFDAFDRKEPSLVLLERYLLQVFSQPRHEHKQILKEKTQSIIGHVMKCFGLEVTLQEFYALRAKAKGANVIGIKPGPHRGTRMDKIVVIGAHYDTVSGTPGVEDNGSGITAVLEAARLITSIKEPLNCTIMFVAFDFEEKGILGSLAFVNYYLIPKELMNKEAHFIGAYVLDMVLNYDTNPGSQSLPYDISGALPRVTSIIRRNKFRGDFVAIWARRSVDTGLELSFKKAWHNLSDHEMKNIVVFDPPIPSNPYITLPNKYSQFFRSDHAAFWVHKNKFYLSTLNAILLTDMGAWRGKGCECYHQSCDDKQMVTPDNLKFLKKVISSLVKSVLSWAY